MQSRNKSDKEISHAGKVVSVSEGETVVEIVSESACSQCHAKGLCSASEQKAKRISVRTKPWEKHYVGEEVEVALARSLGMGAVLISYVIPVVILLILVVSLSFVCESDWIVGSCAIGAVAIYYCVLYLFRGCLSGRYEFYIKTTITN